MLFRPFSLHFITSRLESEFRLSSKQMETDRVNEEPHLSGSYIRSLVKHLTSKDPLHASDENGEFYSKTQKQQRTPTDTQPPQHKKQVRRRLHTSKPYKERLLNMAEARREIVAALKFHRASMKQQEAAAAAANNHTLQSSPQSSLEQEKWSKAKTIHSLYPSTTSTNSYWPVSTYVPPVPPPPLSYDDSQNVILPGQSLGLNLNFQSFSNLDSSIYQKPLSVESPSSSSTPSSSSSPALRKPNSSGDLHHAMDDEEMEEIRSLGKQHQIEWNDTINLVTSARWCSFLNAMKIEAQDGDGFHQFNQIMEFSPWLINANESSCLQQHFDDHFSDAYFQDSALPCDCGALLITIIDNEKLKVAESMDIDEIEAMDGEWLA